MTQNNELTIDQKNEVIAIFEGRKKALVNQKGKQYLYWSDPTGTNPLYSEGLYYHLSWDELMPVWKKAAAILLSWDELMPVWKKSPAILWDIRGDLTRDKCLEAHRITMSFMAGCEKVEIEKAHDAVYNAVQFIQWYNQTTNNGQ